MCTQKSKIALLFHLYIILENKCNKIAKVTFVDCVSLYRIKTFTEKSIIP